MLTRRVRVGDRIKMTIEAPAGSAPEIGNEEIEVVALAVSQREVKLGLAGSPSVAFEHIPNRRRADRHE